MKRMLACVMLALLAAAAPAAAQTDEAAVAAQLQATGSYADPGASVSAAALDDLVTTLNNEGERMYLVALADEPPGGATGFADRVYDILGAGVVVVLSPETFGWSGAPEAYSLVEVDTALDVALATVPEGASDDDILREFVTALTGVDDPAPAAPSPTAPSSGGGGSGLVWLLVIGAVVVGGFFFLRSRSRKAAGERTDSRLAEARAAVQKQIDDLANDIIDLEDEVRTADNSQVSEFYAAAGATYNDVTDAFATADGPEELMDLANQIDRAIWQLDCAEAVLDGKPPPPEPTQRTMPVEPTPAEPTAEPAGPGGLPPRPDYAGTPGSSSLPPRPDYVGRTGRRTSVGGGGLFDVIIGAAGAMMAGRATASRQSPSPGSGSRSGSGSSGSSVLGGGSVLGGTPKPPPKSPPSGKGSQGSGGTRRSGRGGGRRR